MLNGRELVERGIITNVPVVNIQQHGVDLNLIRVEELQDIGRIFIEGKTKLPIYCEVYPINGVWRLPPGIYSVTFDQGCNIPRDQMLLIRQRSSLLRCGGFIHSSVFDAGFKTDNIGTFMVIMHTVEIDFYARIAQIYNHKATEVENLYNGQYQNDKQRNNGNTD